MSLGARTPGVPGAKYALTPMWYRCPYVILRDKLLTRVLVCSLNWVLDSETGSGQRPLKALFKQAYVLSSLFSP